MNFQVFWLFQDCHTPLYTESSPRTPPLGLGGDGNLGPEPTQGSPKPNLPRDPGNRGQIFTKRSYAPPPKDFEGGGPPACLKQAKGTAGVPGRHGLGNGEGEAASLAKAKETIPRENNMLFAKKTQKFPCAPRTKGTGGTPGPAV